MRPNLASLRAAERGPERYCTLKCFILDLSDTGAELMPADITQCPGELMLKPQIGQQRDCEVAWRKGGVVGVRYV
jgi:hypothetical protein